MKLSTFLLAATGTYLILRAGMKLGQHLTTESLREQIQRQVDRALEPGDYDGDGRRLREVDAEVVHEG